MPLPDHKIVDLPALESAISQLDRADLLSAIAGLQLLPENAERVLRLEALAYVVASTGSRRSRKVAPHRLDALCNCQALAAIAHDEDPFDNVFCEELSFHGGSYKVLPGITEHATFVLKRLMEAIFFHNNSFPDAEFARMAGQLILGALALSDRVCTAAGVERNPAVNSSLVHIVIPNGTKLAQLKAATRMSQIVFREFLRGHGLPDDCLTALTVHRDDLVREEELQISGILARRPLVSDGTDLVVASPTELLPALRNTLIALAQDRGVAAELAERFGSATWQAVHEHLSYVNCEMLSITTPAWNDAPAIYNDGFFSLDTDKIIYCIAMTDALADYDREDPFGIWTTPSMTGQMSARLQSIAALVYSQQPQVNEVFALIMIQSVGRWVLLGVGGSDVTSLAIPVADLCTLCLLEGGKDLILWQFAQTRDEIRKHAHITQTGILDEYAVYRKNGYSYYASDDFRPNLIAMIPGGAGTLRREVYRERDWHGVLSYRANELVEVTYLISPDVPVYVPSARLGSHAALVVENLPIPVWITAPDKEIHGKQRQLYREFVDAIAYWIWQFAPAVRPVLDHLSRSHTVLQVVVELDWQADSGDEDEGVPSSEAHSESRVVSAEVTPDRGMIVLRFQEEIEEALSQADNAGERLFIRELLLAIRETGPSTLSRALRDYAIEQTIDQYAPLGLKKKVFYLDLGRVPQLDRRGLPHERHVQEVDKNALLDPIGDHIRSEQQFEVGPIESKRVPRVINEIVAFCYQQFRAIVASLSPESLLEWLVARHEANVSAAAYAQLTMATRMACFGRSPEFLQQAADAFSDASEAAVAGRFLIEYVSAQPPSGLRPISLSAFDALLGRAAIITSYGMVSDIVHFDIAKIEVDMLATGRLGFPQDQYRAAMHEYRLRFAAAQAAGAEERFRRNWKEPGEVDAEWRSQVEHATQAEFGFPLSELVELLTFAIEMGLQNPPLIRMRYDDVVVALAQRNGWNEHKVRTALDLFVSRPREDFFKPGRDYTKEDVYPWRYGRRASYLRRPFLFEESEGAWLIWGHRHMKDAHRYLLQTCFGGRMQAQSDDMKVLVSRHANREGQAFNDTVADRLEQVPDFVVKRKVKKVGRGMRSIQPPGDIDVLVFDKTNAAIYVLECKNLALARTPYELASELRDLTESTLQRRSIIEKHRRRVVWVTQNLDAVLEWAEMDSARTWTVRSAIIVDEPVMSPKLRDLGEPVFSIDDLREGEPGLGLSALCTATFMPVMPVRVE
jgi:hypothetical protein